MNDISCLYYCILLLCDLSILFSLFSTLWKMFWTSQKKQLNYRIDFSFFCFFFYFVSHFLQFHYQIFSFVSFICYTRASETKEKKIIYVHPSVYLFIIIFFFLTLSLSFLASNYFIPLVYFLLTSLLRAYSLFFIHSCMSIITFYSSFPFVYSLISSLYFMFSFLLYFVIYPAFILFFFSFFSYFSGFFISLFIHSSLSFFLGLFSPSVLLLLYLPILLFVCSSIKFYLLIYLFSLITIIIIIIIYAYHATENSHENKKIFSSSPSPSLFFFITRSYGFLTSDYKNYYYISYAFISSCEVL